MKDLVDLSQVAEKKNSNNKVLSKNDFYLNHIDEYEDKIHNKLMSKS